MAPAKILPEDKLLRLIKGARPGNKAAALESPSPDITLARKAPEMKLSFSYTHLKICMTVLLAFAVALFVKNLFFPSNHAEGLNKPATRAVEPAAVSLNDKPLESYLAGTDSKAVFNIVTETAAENPEAAAGEQAALEESVQGYNLIGVISGAQPQAIIEDTKNQKTLYLTKDQFIGKMRITDIQENKVVLEYKGKQTELHL